VHNFRILQLSSRYLQPGGEERFAELFAATLSPPHRVENYFGSTQALRGSGILDSLSMPSKAWHNYRVAGELRALQARENFDLWVIQNSLPGLSPAVYQTAFSLGVPVVHYLHNFRLACTNGFFLNHGAPCERCLQGNFWPAFQTACWRNSRLISGFMGLLIRRVRHLGTFHKVRTWVALNHQQKAKHVEMGIPAERIHVVPHFFETLHPPPPPNPLGDILFLGRLSKEKGVDLLIQAWAQLRSEGRTLLIAGEGPEDCRLKHLASSLSLQNVKFLGYQPRQEHSQLWSRVSALVVPSIWEEAFGMIVLEAWAHARPVVGFSKGALAELISDKVDGLLVKPASSSSLSKSLQAILDFPNQTQAMGLAGYQKVVSEFNRDRWVTRISAVFDTALKK